MCCGTAFLMEGWLAKRGPLYGWTWERRWCVLHPCGLLEYYSDDARTSKKGSIELQATSRAMAFGAAQSIGDGVKHARERPFGFTLDLDWDAGRDRRLIYFDAGAPETMDAWMAAVAKLAGSFASRVEEVAKGLGLPSIESPTEAAARIGRQLNGAIEGSARALRICFLGGSSILGGEARELIKIIAEKLAASFGERAAFITSGMPAIQKALVKHCHNGARVWNLVPLGHESGLEGSRDIHAGSSSMLCRETLVQLGDIYISVEGGPEVAKQAEQVHGRGAGIVPLVRAGGASSGMFGFPREALERPKFASEDQWKLLGDTEAPLSAAADAAVSLVEAYIAECADPGCQSDGGQKPQADIENNEPLERAQGAAAPPFDASRYRLQTVNIHDSLEIFNVDLHNDITAECVQKYYHLCRDRVGLHVTTSCFNIWRKHSKTNQHAKVIPAVPSDDNNEAVRIFFFDDNADTCGGADSEGICNLRDITTGEYIEFGAGKNGFEKDKIGSHTLVLHSTSYKNVIVKANILDAMADPEYFTHIVDRYAQKGEKLILFMDVNSTIVCNDTVIGKDSTASVLSTLCSFVTWTPDGGEVQLEFDSLPPIKINKPRHMKQIAQDLLKGASHEVQSHFWKETTCAELFKYLDTKGKLAWSGEDERMTFEKFNKLFQEYLDVIPNVTSRDGITKSWFHMHDALRDSEHTIVLNSFGVDTRKVVLATLQDESTVQQVAVNYEMWDGRDVTKFTQQFEA